jgi:hypothetical protein
MEQQSQIIGGVRLEPNLSFTAPEDDNFKLWGSEDGSRWLIVYCLVLDDCWEVDHVYWDGSEWRDGEDKPFFAEAELAAQVAAAWQARARAGR